MTTGTVGPVASVAVDFRDGVYDILSGGHLTEDRVMPVPQPRGGRDGDKELAAVGSWTGVGRGQTCPVCRT